MTTTDRNAPCPCGSGRKYKRCCLDKERQAPPPRGPRAMARDEVFQGVLRFAGKQGIHPEDLVAGIPEHLVDDVTWPFWAHFMAFHALDGEDSIARQYLASPRRLAHRELIEADIAAWATVLEITEVEPGTAFVATDLLSGERHEIADVWLSHQLAVHSLVMALLAEHEGEIDVSNAHPVPLSPSEGREVLGNLRSTLELADGQLLTRQQLRAFDMKSGIAVGWSMGVQSLLDRPEPDIVTSDGDPLIVVTDHFRMTTGDADSLLERARTLEGASDPIREDGETRITFTRTGNVPGIAHDRTIMGHLVISGSRVTLATNSLARADLMRERLLEGCGDLVELRGRETADPRAVLERMSSDDDDRADARMPPEQAVRFLMAYKEKHYGDWPDHALPALDGLTPRQAAAGSPAMRARLDLLLKDLEHHESLLPEPERYDVSRLRRSLGMT